MKVWQKILLQAGIFTSVFALGAGTGFILNYHYVEDEQPTSEGHAIVVTDPDTPHIETPTEKYLNGLVTAKALEGDVNLTISTAKENNGPEGVKAGIQDLNLGEINLAITDLQVSIADIDNIKVAGDINIKMGKLDLDLSLGYFDNTIYLDYADTHFSLKTDDITDVMDMLPTFGVNFEMPSELSLDGLDFDALTGSLANMEEHKENSEHYFLFQFNENIAIKMLSDDEYNMIGVELPQINLMGMNISATSTIHPLTEDIETLINPSKKDGAPEYTEFKPAFRLINDVMDLVNAKAARVELDVDLNKLDDNDQYAEFLGLDAVLDFDINELALATDLTVTYADKPYSLSAAYLDETIYASYKNLNLSIKQQSVLSLVEYISTKISNDKLDEVMDKLGDVSSEIDLDTILTLVNDLPQFISNFKLTNTSLSFTFDPSYFNIPVTQFDLAVTFDDTSVTGLSLKGLAYGGFEVNVDINVKPYVKVELNPDDYLAIDPALSLIGSIERLLTQEKYGLTFSVTTDDGDETTNDLDASGVFHFALRDKTESEFESHMIKTRRTFDYGAGELTIHDGDNYPHNIRVDAQPYTEEMSGKVLFSYGGTTDVRTNARMDYATFDSLVDRIITLFQSEDPHVMEVFGSMIESAESSPLGIILASKTTADYLKLLDYDIITYLNITENEVTVSINGALLGLDDSNPTLNIRYTADSLSGLDISGLNLGGKTLEISANLVEFDQETYEYYQQTEDSSYIDLSTISKLVEEALKTAEKSYFHAKGTIDFELDSSILNALGSLAGNQTMIADLQINTDHGHTTVLAHLTDIPVLPVVSVNHGLHNNSKDAYLMFDNLDDSAAGVGKTGIFHIWRHDEWKPTIFSSLKTEDVYSKYETPILLENIITVLMGDLLGFGDTILGTVSNIESGSGQIHYEKIIENYQYTAGYSLKNKYYNNNNATAVDKYYFAINVGELAQNDDLKTLALTAYAREGELAGVQIDMSLDPGVGMTLCLKMFLQDDTSATPVSDMYLANGMSMTAYATAHANDPLNQRA